MTADLVWVVRDGEFLEVNIAAVAAHEAAGWKVSDDGPKDKAAAKEVKAKAEKTEAERAKAAKTAADIVEADRVKAEQKAQAEQRARTEKKEY